LNAKTLALVLICAGLLVILLGTILFLYSYPSNNQNSNAASNIPVPSSGSNPCPSSTGCINCGGATFWGAPSCPSTSPNNTTSGNPRGSSQSNGSSFGADPCPDGNGCLNCGGATFWGASTCPSTPPYNVTEPPSGNNVQSSGTPNSLSAVEFLVTGGSILSGTGLLMAANVLSSSRGLNRSPCVLLLSKR
jgi:hypothetical protein